MFFKSILSLLCIAQAVQSSPITSRDSTGTISCSDTDHYGALSLTQAPYGGVVWPVTFGEFSQGGGQETVQVAVTNNADQIGIIYKQCNSTNLGLSYHEQYYPGNSPIKIYNSHNISQCLQRSPTLNNQVIMTDCSNLDDSIQQDQFWVQDLPYGLVYPISFTNKQVKQLNVALSGETYGNLVAGAGSSDQSAPFALRLSA